MSEFTFRDTVREPPAACAANDCKGQPWSYVVDNERVWSSNNAGARAAIASLAARRLQEAVDSAQAPAHGGPGLTVPAKESLRNGSSGHARAESLHQFLQSAAGFAAGKLAERLPLEAHADVLTALLALTASLSHALQLLIARADAAAASSGASLAHACAAAVAAGSQQLLAASPAALGQLQQLGHPNLACGWVRALCEVGSAVQACSSVRWPRELKMAFRRELRAALQHATQALAAPPRDAFADVAGAPAQPQGTAEKAAAQRWRQGCALYLCLLPRMLQLLASLHALEPHASQAQNGGHHPGAEAEGVERLPEAPQSSSAGSFWEDLRCAGAAGAAAARPQVGRGGGASGPGPRLLEVRSQGNGSPAPAPPQQPPAPLPQLRKRALIQELPGDEEGERRATISAGGVLIKELADEDRGGAGSSGDDEEVGALERVSRPDLAAALLACALHGTDAALDAPWATAGSHAAATTVLETLAAHAGAPGQQPAQQGDGGRAAQRSSGAGGTALASLQVQNLIVELLPSALQPLSAVLVESSEQMAAKARLEVYRGPDVFERAVAAQQLAWLVRRLGYAALGGVVGRALPCISAAAGDPSPAVQRQGLWALHHLATEALPSDLRWQREALLRVARRSLVGCDESAWPAAAPAACALAVALEGRDVFGAGYEGVLAEMLVQGNNYAHVRPRRLVWLQAAQPLLEAMGLATVRAFSRLLPLLLEWVHAPDLDTRLAALRALRSVLARAWPRLPAHASLIWQHIAREYESECALARASAAAAADDLPSVSGADRSASEATPSESVAEGSKDMDAQRREAYLWLERVAEVLWWGGGEPFREEVVQSCHGEDVESLIRAASRPR